MTQKIHGNNQIEAGTIVDAGIASNAAINADKIADGTTNKVMTATQETNFEAAYSHVSSTSNPHSVTAAQVGAIPTSQKGAASGVCPLDSGSKIDVAYLPASTMEYLGTWAASTNTPTLADGTGSAGSIYVASDAGTVNFGAGNITFAAGDWVIYSGSVWQKSINSNSVASVNGQTGAVVLDTDDVSDVSATNKYFTASAAKAAAVSDSITDGVTDVAPSQNAVFDALALKQSTTLVDGKILVGNGSNVATAVTPSGDVTISNTGATAIASGVIVNADVNASAAIDESKLNLAYGTSALNSAISGKVAASNFVYNEVPSGTINGVNDNFVLANTPTAGTCQVFVRGLLQRPTTDYTVATATITFTTAPATGDGILVHYMK